jgi:hypothetical protein
MSILKEITWKLKLGNIALIIEPYEKYKSPTLKFQTEEK